jgi:glyoxylase-like metal-dependent hydrolase (beta-lactamase superfamily II)
VNIYTFTPSGYFGSNTYLIECDGEIAVVDPSVSRDTVIEKTPYLIGEVKYVLLTHGHFDHFLEIKSWLTDESKVFIGLQDKNMLRDSRLNCFLTFLGVDDGFYGEVNEVNSKTRLKLGNCEISVIECPGHTPGGVSFVIKNNIFVGDTVFRGGGYGRCDLPGGDSGALCNTLKELFKLEDDYILYPGHGDKTKLKDVKKFFV